MFDSLITFAAGWTAAQVWIDLKVMRDNDPKAAPDLPATKAELERQIRVAKSQGLLVEGEGGELRRGRVETAPAQRELFS